MGQPKFFHQLKDPLKLFFGMKNPKRSEQADRQLVLTFRVALNGNNVRSSPKFVQSAYDEIKNGADYVGLKKELENVNVDLFNLEEKKRPDFKLPMLHIEKMCVKEVKNSQGDTSIVLCFEAQYPWDESIWDYLGDHYSTDVWARFDSAQATLMDLEEAEEKGEDLPIGAELAEVEG